MLRKLFPYVCVLVTPAAYATDQPTCLIVKHTSVAHQVLVNWNNWQYVAGDFPKGMKWKSNLTDRNIRQIKEHGGHVAIVPQNYTADDVQKVFATCRSETSEAAK